jgi:hypothetical protein
MHGQKPAELADVARITARQWRQYETRLNLSNSILTGLRFLKVFENESVRTYPCFAKGYAGQAPGPPKFLGLPGAGPSYNRLGDQTPG